MMNREDFHKEFKKEDYLIIFYGLRSDANFNDLVQNNSLENTPCFRPVKVDCSTENQEPESIGDGWYRYTTTATVHGHFGAEYNPTAADLVPAQLSITMEAVLLESNPSLFGGREKFRVTTHSMELVSGLLSTSFNN